MIISISSLRYCFVLSCSFIMSITTLTLTPALILWDYLFQMWRAVQDSILSARTHTSVVKITILDGKDVEVKADK